MAFQVINHYQKFLLNLMTFLNLILSDIVRNDSLF